MSQDPRNVPLKLHSAIEMTAALLDLPLDTQQREALALELTGPVRALIAEALAAAGDDTPVRYAVTAGEPVADSAEFEATEYAGCLARVGLDVDLDSPAAELAARLRSTQYDVIATEVPDARTLGITVRPQSLDCWRWWMHRLGIDPATVTADGTAVTATGCCKGVTVRLRGESVPDLLTDHAAARLMGVIVETEPARP
ncbi:hypothetical protein ABZT17_12260 [Streptomyces sp. NPDC005648]|uniref:hypothetical protein n=1 Tax=Streptomyces sp. NPDC005648 TaxID=3157044 RepID=UPI0033B13F46